MVMMRLDRLDGHAELMQREIVDLGGENAMRGAILFLIGIVLLATSVEADTFSEGDLQFCQNTVHSGADAIAMQYSEQQIERNLCMAQKYSALAAKGAQPAAAQKACADAAKVMTTAFHKRNPAGNPNSVADACP